MNNTIKEICENDIEFVHECLKSRSDENGESWRKIDDHTIAVSLLGSHANIDSSTLMGFLDGKLTRSGRYISIP